jgi:hypothetical protein
MRNIAPPIAWKSRSSASSLARASASAAARRGDLLVAHDGPGNAGIQQRAEADAPTASVRPVFTGELLRHAAQHLPDAPREFGGIQVAELAVPRGRVHECAPRGEVLSGMTTRGIQRQPRRVAVRDHRRGIQHRARDGVRIEDGPQEPAPLLRFAQGLLLTLRIRQHAGGPHQAAARIELGAAAQRAPAIGATADLDAGLQLPRSGRFR